MAVNILLFFRDWHFLGCFRFYFGCFCPLGSKLCKNPDPTTALGSNTSSPNFFGYNVKSGGIFRLNFGISDFTRSVKIPPESPHATYTKQSSSDHVLISKQKDVERSKLVRTYPRAGATVAAVQICQ